MNQEQPTPDRTVILTLIRLLLRERGLGTMAEHVLRGEFATQLKLREQERRQVAAVQTDLGLAEW